LYIKDAFFEELYKIKEKDDNVVLLTADYADNNKWLNVGITEQTMVNIAIGQALCGKKVFCCCIDAFLVRRALDQIYQACCMKLPIVFVGVGVDRDYLTDGATHWSEGNDVIMSQMPNLLYIKPTNIGHAINVARRAYELKPPVYVRLKR
jgi:transketolase C-terminal domain/subunit